MGEFADETASKTSMRRVTIKDVAQRANVAFVTVSRALRTPELVNKKTRQAVLNAVEELGYIRDSAASSLKSHRTGIVAAIVPSVDNATFSTTLQGLNDAIESRGYELMVGTSGLGHKHEERLVRSFLGRRPDGIVLTGVGHSEMTRNMLRSEGIPVIETWNLTDNPIDANIGFSNVNAMKAATEYLMKSGRRRLAFIGGHLEDNDRSTARRDGFLSAVSNAGLSADLVFALPFPNAMRSIADVVSRALTQAPNLDAIVCSGDAFAIATIFECQRRGKKVPDDIAVAGLGDVELATYIMPALTTARVPGYKMGQLAGETIIERLGKAGAAKKMIDLGFELSVREST